MKFDFLSDGAPFRELRSRPFMLPFYIENFCRVATEKSERDTVLHHRFNSDLHLSLGPFLCRGGDGHVGVVDA